MCHNTTHIKMDFNIYDPVFYKYNFKHGSPVTVRVDAFEPCEVLYNIRVLTSPGRSVNPTNLEIYLFFSTCFNIHLFPWRYLVWVHERFRLKLIIAILQLELGYSTGSVREWPGLGYSLSHGSSGLHRGSPTRLIHRSWGTDVRQQHNFEY